MAFEYFLYDTNFNNTLIDRSATTFAPLSPNTGEVFIDFLIPQTQPLYLYKENLGLIVLNDQATIEAYLAATNPPTDGSTVNQGDFTGYTAQTSSDIISLSAETTLLLNDKLAITDFNIYSGITATELSNLNDGITGNTQSINNNDADIIYLSGETDTKLNTSDFDTYSGVTDTRLDGIDSDITYISGETASNDADILYLSGQTDTKLNTSDFDIYSGVTDTRITNNDNDIVYISGETASNDADIIYLSGQTDTKIDKVTGATDNLAIFLPDGNVKDSGVSIESITGGTGFYYYIDKSVTESTTSIVNVVYLSGTSDILSDGIWSIDFNAIGGNLSPNKYVGVSFYIDNIIQGVENYFKTNDANVIMPFVITKDLTLTAGTHVFEIRYRNVGGTARIEYGSIRARIVQ